MRELHTIDTRKISYNIEMAEITGGTFWKSYEPSVRSGAQKLSALKCLDRGSLTEHREPINLSNPRLRKLAAALGGSYIRVGGLWATKTYYDFNGDCKGQIPNGFGAVLSREQWTSLLDFVRAVNGKLVVSLSNCQGVHDAEGHWLPEQADKLFEFCKEYGVPVYAAEFMNEPDLGRASGVPKGYSPNRYGQDHDCFCRFVREKYPEIKTAGPATLDGSLKMRWYVKHALSMHPSETYLTACKEPNDIYSYHMYGCGSERGSLLAKHLNEADALSEEYLSIPEKAFHYHEKLRKTYVPNAALWVTESADGSCGGNSWAATYLDVIRTAEELGRFYRLTNGVIFHNTLASSDYGLLDENSFLPRPNYWFLYLYRQLMGNVVYLPDKTNICGLYVYVHSKADRQKGYAYMVVNPSPQNCAYIETSCPVERYTLTSNSPRSDKVLLNGKVLALELGNRLPELKPVFSPAGKIGCAPLSINFLLTDGGECIG